jgi:nucleotide-binding universal stress UspA family protein
MSEKFRKVLVAFDGSEFAATAVEAAVSLSTSGESELIVVHVYSPSVMTYAGVTGMPIPNISDLEDAMKVGAQKTLDRGLELVKKAGSTARGELLESPSTVQAIVEFASNEKVDLIVVGTRGMGTFKKLLLGSVSSGLVSHATSSVLVVR